MSDRRPGVRQRPSIWRRLDRWARYGFPSACTLALILLLEAPLGLGIAPQLQLALTLASVFFWSVHRPASMPAAVAFALGLLIDLLQSQPIGLSSLVLLIVTGLARHWRHDLRRQGFALGWVGFGVAAIGAVTVIYAGTSVLRWMLLPVTPSLAALVLALVSYPLLALLFSRAHRGAAAPEEA